MRVERTDTLYSELTGDMTTKHSPKKSGRKHPPSGPLVLDTRELGRRPGEMQEVHRTAPAPASVGLELIRVSEGSPLDLDLRMESVAEGVLVSGSVSAVAIGDCGRCLDPVTQDLTVSLMELYAYPGSATEQTTDEDEVSRLTDDRVELEEVVRNAIVLALPLTPLCRPDCGGLCAGCGQKWDDLPADHEHELIDPRWAALRDKVGDDPTP